MSECKKMTFSEFARKYCERQDNTPQVLLGIFQNHGKTFQPEGWFMLECHDMSSSLLGSLVILPYGGTATYKAIPTHPVSPLGLASDMSTACGFILASELPESLPADLNDWTPPPEPKVKRKRKKKTGLN